MNATEVYSEVLSALESLGKNDSGDRFGMMCVYDTTPEFQVI